MGYILHSQLWFVIPHPDLTVYPWVSLLVKSSTIFHNVKGGQFTQTLPQGSTGTVSSFWLSQTMKQIFLNINPDTTTVYNSIVTSIIILYFVDMILKSKSTQRRMCIISIAVISFSPQRLYQFILHQNEYPFSHRGTNANPI